MPVCIIHLIRHGEHDLPAGILAGHTPGVALAQRGYSQAELSAAQLADRNLRAVLTSPVQRTRQAADLIASALGLIAQPEAGLGEIDFGSWAGERFDLLERLPAWQAWNGARSLAQTPAGETMLAVQARAMATLMRAGAHGGAIAAVSHADVIKSVLAYALGMPLDLLQRLEIALGSRSVLVLGDDFIRVEAINLSA